MGEVLFVNKYSAIENNKSSGIPLRVLVIGLASAIINSYWISINDYLKGLNHTYMSLFSNTVFTLFVLILLNLLLKKLLPKFALRESDLLVIYIMVVMVSTVSGHRMTRLLGPIVHPFWFTTPENDWQNLFWRHIPQWFTVKDKNVLSGFFRGESSFFTRQHVKAWLGPLLYWSVFLFVLCFILICINTIIRKQFTEHERLTYPITRLPLELGRDTPAFLKNKLMWAGFGIAAGISLLNGLSVFYPFLPAIHVGWRVIAFHDKPWNYMGSTRISFQPFVIGLSFFMPLDLAFSAWFFYLLKKMTQLLLGATTGVRDLYFSEQIQGAWIGLGLLALWVGRRHLKQVFTQGVTGKHRIDDSKEPMRYRTALLGIIGGLLFFLLFAYKAGLSLWVILLFLGIYCCSAIGVTKIRSGLGPPVHEILLMDPARTMVTSMGTRTFGPRNLTILSFFYGLSRDQPAHPMPNQIEAFRIGEQSNINNRKLVWAMIIAFAVGIPVTFLIYLSLSYHYGAAIQSEIVGMGRESFAQRLHFLLNFPTTHDYVTASFMGLGFCITAILTAMKMRFLWWPFHPIGYILGMSPAEMVYIWVPVLISWSLKFVILKYGGLQAYRRAIPFFAGLILGDYTMGCIWSIINAVFKITTYNMGWHPVMWWVVK